MAGFGLANVKPRRYGQKLSALYSFSIFCTQLNYFINMFIVITPDHTEQVRVNKIDPGTLWNCRQSLGQGKITSKGLSAVSPISIWKFRTRRTTLWPLQAPTHASRVQVGAHKWAEKIA